MQQVVLLAVTHSSSGAHVALDEHAALAALAPVGPAHSGVPDG
jgi:hypothetical protein